MFWVKLMISILCAFDKIDVGIGERKTLRVVERMDATT